MKRHTTSVAEIREAGILLRGSGEHRIRVLGAHREMPAPGPSGSKEEIAQRDAPDFESYYAGSAPPAEAQEPALRPRVPRLFVTADGIDFVRRDGSD